MRLRPTVALALTLPVPVLDTAAPAAAQAGSELTIALAGMCTEVLGPTVGIAARHRDQFTNGAGQ
jgi:hypothetical protein